MCTFFVVKTKWKLMNENVARMKQEKQQEELEAEDAEEGNKIEWIIN